MSHTLTVSDQLYARLEDAVREGGHASIEELLEAWQAVNQERLERHRVVEETDRIFERMAATYGQMPESVDLIREDRER